MTRRRVAADRAVAAIEPTTPCARAARAIEEPIRPTPIKARRLKSGASVAAPPPPLSRSRRSLRFAQEFGERLHHQPVGFLGADAHAQGMRQLVGADLTQDEAARGEEGVGILGG